MDNADLVRLHRGVKDDHVHLNPAHVEGLRRVADAVWEEALQYVWKLNDPACTCFHAELWQSERDIGILLTSDVDQARDANPYVD